MTGYFRCRPTPALSSSLDHEPIWYTEWSSNNSIRASQMHSRTRRGHVANTRQRTQRPVRLSTNHEPIWVIIISTIDLCQQWNLGEAVLAAVFLASQWEAVQLTKVIRTETIAFLHQGNDYSYFSLIIRTSRWNYGVETHRWVDQKLKIFKISFFGKIIWHFPQGYL